MLTKVNSTRPFGGPAGALVLDRFTATTEVTVSGLDILADIGIHDHEVGQLQPLRLNVRLQVAPTREDRINEAFDYTNVLVIAQELASQRVALIETFAQRVALACLSNPMVIEAEVEVQKPRALPGRLAAARVKLRRPRER